MFSAGDNTMKAGQQNPAALLQVPLAKPHSPTCLFPLHTSGMQQLLGRLAEVTFADRQLKACTITL